jgi:hypothetical protein
MNRQSIARRRTRRSYRQRRAPIVVQSMTNTDTADVAATVAGQRSRTLPGSSA